MAEKPNGFNAGGLFAGDNGKAFFDWMGKNQRAQEIFMGLLEEFGKGMGLQNQVAQVQLGNAAVAAAGFRPGQYVSARQRREAILAATDPGKADADKLARLQFHGGMADGRWTNNYDEWKAASKNGHGTNWKGEEIKTKSFGFSVPVSGPSKQDREAFERNRSVNAAWARSSSRLAGGERRGVRLGSSGSMEIHFGDTGVKTDISAGRSGTSLAARRRMEMLTNTDPSNGPWMFDDEGRLKSDHAAVGGGQSGRLSMFGVMAPTNRYDWAIERERAWDRTMDRADRTIAEVVASARRPPVSDYDPVRVSPPGLSDALMTSSWWDTNRTRQLSNPLYKDVPRAASKGGGTMRDRGWLDAVFARAERAAMRGGRTRR